MESSYKYSFAYCLEKNIVVRVRLGQQKHKSWFPVTDTIISPIFCRLVVPGLVVISIAFEWGHTEFEFLLGRPSTRQRNLTHAQPQSDPPIIIIIITSPKTKNGVESNLRSGVLFFSEGARRFSFRACLKAIAWSQTWQMYTNRRQIFLKYDIHIQLYITLFKKSR